MSNPARTSTLFYLILVLIVGVSSSESALLRPGLKTRKSQVLRPGLITCLISSVNGERPDLESAIHLLGTLSSTFWNNGMLGDPWEIGPSMEWPVGSNNQHLFSGGLCASCYGAITPDDSVARWVFQSAGDFSPSEGCPMEYLVPGPVAPEQSQFGMDDWDPGMNQHPCGFQAWVENYSWDTPGFDGFISSEMVITHHSEHGNPGVPLHGLVISIRSDCDVATADISDCHLDDLVYYDGHAIWCNDPDATFEFVNDYGIPAQDQDGYTLMRNPDNPLPPDDPDNVIYHYNYLGSDGIPDHDADLNGVSDHLTILAKVCGQDTLHIQDPESGIMLFSQGMPGSYWEHTVGDTTYLVVPRSMSYMWDSDSPGSMEDDTGEPLSPVHCNGFIGWRLIDCWIDRPGCSIDRPIDVLGCPIPLSHQWWNWEEDPPGDWEMYDFIWGINPGGSGLFSGPSYMDGWVGDPCAPEAVLPENPGPFPFVRDCPAYLGYPVFDYRFLISLGPFTLDDGDTLHIVGAWVMGRGLDDLRMNADLLLDSYYRPSVWGQGTAIGGIVPATTASMLTVYPNPMTSAGFVSFTLPAECSISVRVYDLSGRMVLGEQSSTLQAGEHSVPLSVYDLSPGVYMVRLDTAVGVTTTRFVVL